MSYNIQPSPQDAINLAQISKEQAKRAARRISGREWSGKDLGQQLGIAWI